MHLFVQIINFLDALTKDPIGKVSIDVMDNLTKKQSTDKSQRLNLIENEGQ